MLNALNLTGTVVKWESGSRAAHQKSKNAPMSILNLSTDKCKLFSFIIIKFSLEAYRYLSALAPSGKYWSIGTNVFNDTMQQCKGFIDYITVR